MQRPVLRATTLNGLELPIVDVTHPAFRVDVTEAELSVLLARFLAEDEKLARLPRFLRAALVGLVLRRSVLAGGLRRARGAFDRPPHRGRAPGGGAAASIEKLERIYISRLGASVEVDGAEQEKQRSSALAPGTFTALLKELFRSSRPLPDAAQGRPFRYAFL